MKTYSDAITSTEEEIIISGISGRFPESNNITEFASNLFNGVDLITEDDRRWPPGIYGLPCGSGKLKSISKFDPQFFGVNAKFADRMDPQHRIFLELCHEAIIDAGYNPSELRGSRTGVFIGISETETIGFRRRDLTNTNKFGVLEHYRSMACNQVSFVFDFKGPSYSIDSACSSSFMALHSAVQAVKNGECEAAVVGGMSLCLDPASALQLQSEGILSTDGRSKCFDASANGYARAEAVVALFIQKHSCARRVYATIIGTKTSTDGSKVEGVIHPSRITQIQLFRDIYTENNIDPLDVSYIEAHCTGTAVGDPEEGNAVATFFCNNRKEPLLIGSVKSNMGHAEAAAGLCSLVKVLISMQHQQIPGNLHFETPNPNIPALLDAKLKVVRETTPWTGGVVGISCLGAGGTNVHCILKSNTRTKTQASNLNPRIIGVSGQTPEAVSIFLNYIETHKDDTELLALIHQIHKYNINNHFHRGYICLTQNPIREVSKVSSKPRPIWFIYSGVGAQWPGMATSLMTIALFKASIIKSAQILKPFGIDLVDIVTNPAESTFDCSLLNIFVGSIAVQIALTDILLDVLELKASGFIGHSTGEILCGYVDGSLTHEEALLVGYARGCAFLDKKNVPGAMAAVGLTWAETQLQCPSDVAPVCHNSVDNVTVAGPRASVESFVKNLKARKIFAKQVNSSNIALHSKYIAENGPAYLTLLEKIIQSPKARSTRWISTSIPEAEWGSELAQTSSPAYYTNNLLKPVLFYEGLQHVPDNAICIEIGASGLLQGILRKTLNPGATNINLMKRGNPNNDEYLLSAFGKIYNAGAQPKLEKLYTPMSFPVGNGTPTLSSIVRWNHSTDWSVQKFQPNKTIASGNATTINLNNEEDRYLSGHRIDGCVIYPVAGYLVLVWKTLANLHSTVLEQLPVVFKDLIFYQATTLSEQQPTKLLVNILEATNRFEVLESETILVTGQIRTLVDTKPRRELFFPDHSSSKKLSKKKLTKDHVYTELRLRGYEHQGSFQGISSADLGLRNGLLEWNNNWVTFIDSMLQFGILSEKHLRVPTQIRSVVIDPRQQTPGSTLVNVIVNHNVIQTECIEIQGLKTTIVQNQDNNEVPYLATYSFVPYQDQNQKTTNDVLSNILGIVGENCAELKLKITEVTTAVLETDLITDIKKIAGKVFVGTIEGKVLTTGTVSNVSGDVKLIKEMKREQNLIVLRGTSEENLQSMLQKYLPFLSGTGFMLVETTKNVKNVPDVLVVVSTQITSSKHYTLLRKPITVPLDSTIIKISSDTFDWLEPLKTAMAATENDSRIYLYAQGSNTSAIISTVSYLKREPGGTCLRTMSIEDPNVGTLAPHLSQLRKDLVHNVLRGTTWGSFHNQSLNYPDQKNVSEAFLGIGKIGDLRTLKWIEASLSLKSNVPGMELCQVHYAGLNVKDVMLACGQLNIVDSVLGLEFSGTDPKGRRIMGITNSNSIATSVLADSYFLCEIPDTWTFAEAATIPAVYTTVYYGLIMTGQLQPSESVLIHSGAGGIGQAAISLALSMECKVYTTVGTAEQREFLKNLFPQLSDDCIGNSQDGDFEFMIQKQTDRCGVNVVLNSLPDKLLQVSLRCLAFGGRFIDVGNANIAQKLVIDMEVFSRNISFHGVSLNSLFYEAPARKAQITLLIKEGIKKEVVKPIVSRVFDKNEVEEAFQYMASGTHIRKVLIKIRELENVTIPAVPRTYFDSKKTYIFVDGLGEMGLEFVKWCVQRQATKVVINSKTGIKTGYQELCVQRLEQQDIKILISTDDVTTETGAKNLLKRSLQLGSIGGIFNLTLVFTEPMSFNQTKDLKTVYKSTIKVTKNLDETSRSLAPELDHFVCFSSMVSDHLDQVTCGLANSTMERICEQRKKDNLPGLAIKWGLVENIGVVADSKVRTFEGYVPQKISSCLSTLDIFLSRPEAVLSSTVLDQNAKEIEPDQSESILQKVVSILGFEDMALVYETLSLYELGLDSIMVIEIQKLLEEYFNNSWKREGVRALTFAQLKKLDSDK